MVDLFQTSGDYLVIYLKCSPLFHIEVFDHAASCNAPVKTMSEDYAGICIEFSQMTSDLQSELQT